MRTLKKEIVKACITEVAVSHNGIQGGDAGHGGFVNIRFKDIASTCMFVNGKETGLFDITFRGDHEREMLIEAMEMILKELKENQ